MGGWVQCSTRHFKVNYLNWFRAKSESGSPRSGKGSVVGGIDEDNLKVSYNIIIDI